MRLLVTGGLGFVGANVVRHAALSGWHVTALDRRSPDRMLSRYLLDVRSRVTHVLSDLGEADWAGDPALERPFDAVVHAAAVTAVSPDDERDRAADLFAVNVVGTLHLMDWASRVRPGRIVHVSSGSVYGPVRRGASTRESHSTRPTGLYGISKLAGEQLARRSAELHRLDLVVARLTHVYGPMERVSPDRPALSPIHGWSVAALAGLPITAPAAPYQRDYVHAEDAADALLRLADAATRLRYPVYNVSATALRDDRDIAALIWSIASGAPTATGSDAAARAAVTRPALDAARLRTELGWQPRDLAQGLADYIAWLSHQPS